MFYDSMTFMNNFKELKISASIIIYFKILSKLSYFHDLQTNLIKGGYVKSLYKN